MRGSCASGTEVPRLRLNQSTKERWDDYSHLWTSLWIPVDDPPSSCGRVLPDLGTQKDAGCVVPVRMRRPQRVHSRRAHACELPDLRRRARSPGSTEAKTTTTVLQEEDPQPVSALPGGPSPVRSLRTCDEPGPTPRRAVDGPGGPGTVARTPWVVPSPGRHGARGPRRPRPVPSWRTNRAVEAHPQPPFVGTGALVPRVVFGGPLSALERPGAHQHRPAPAGIPGSPDREGGA